MSTQTPTVITRTRDYLTESWAELRKVAWPTRRTVVNLTLIVIAWHCGCYIDPRPDPAVRHGSPPNSPGTTDDH
jgi:hypothetical protein